MSQQLRALAVAGLLAASAAPSGAAEQTVEDFYKTHTIEFYTGGGAGNVYDQWARLIAHGLQPRLPGHPTFIVRNMPGGGDLVVTNFLFNQAPRDGTILGLVSRNMPTQEALGVAAVRFKTTEFNYIGSPEFTQRVCVASSQAKVKNAQDLFTTQLLVGGTGAGSAVSTSPILLSKLFGMKLKLVEGYRNGPQIFLAMDRGEVEGVCQTLSAIEASRPGAIAKGDVRVLFNLDANPLEGIDAPSIQKFAKTDEQRRILTFYNSNVDLGRPLLTTPGVPADRLAALRKAFDGLMADPAFRAEVKKAGFEVNPISADVVARRVKEIIDTPQEIIDKTVALVGKM
jgi:tripartite-type tricarboxylate transporter receptor subunit TctC